MSDHPQIPPNCAAFAQEHLPPGYVGPIWLFPGEGTGRGYVRLYATPDGSGRARLKAWRSTIAAVAEVAWYKEAERNKRDTLEIYASLTSPAEAAALEAVARTYRTIESEEESTAHKNALAWRAWGERGVTI